MFCSKEKPIDVQETYEGMLKVLSIELCEEGKEQGLPN